MIKYSVGQQVDVQFKTKSVFLYGDSEYELHSIKGTIVQTPSWVNYPAVAIKTGNPNFPLSIVHVENIIGGTAVKQVDELRAYSEGKYIVTKVDGNVTCTCVGFQYRRYCKHSDKHM